VDLLAMAENNGPGMNKVKILGYFADRLFRDKSLWL
jgi:hypothetical protein